MTPIAPQTVYTKTAKGILEIRNKSVKLPKELSAVFPFVDGKTTVEALLPASGLSVAQLHHALNTLVADGYIKTVSSPAQQAPAPAATAADTTQLEFGSSAQEVSRLNLEVASHALAETEAAKHAQQEARAALEARLRQEAEARARALAETRAQAEAEARAKAEAAARVAADAQAQAEREASAASDPDARAEAEARARSAAASAVRAQAEARARADAEERARSLAEEKKGAEQHAREEADARAHGEEQAQARAAAEGRAKAALEAQLQAIQSVQAHAGHPEDHDAEVARQQLHASEAAARRAREEATAIAQAQGEVQVEPAELHFDDLAQKLTAKVQAERRAREENERKTRAAAAQAEAAATTEIEQRNPFPSLELVPHAEPSAPLTLSIDIPDASAPAGTTATAPGREEPANAEVPDLPALSFSSTTGPADVPHITPEHVPSALERAMLQRAASVQGENENRAPAQTEIRAPAAGMRAAAPQSGRVVPPQREPTKLELHDPALHDPVPQAQAVAPPSAETETTPSEKVEPSLEDTGPLPERLNVDRAAHDILAEAASTRRSAEVAELARSAANARRQRMDEETRRETNALQQIRRKRRNRMIAAAIVAAPLMGIAYLQYVPLNGYIPEAQQALSERLNQPATISTLRYVLLPTPRVVLEGVNVGVSPGIRIDKVQAHAWPFSFLGGVREFSTVDVTGVTVDTAMLGAIPSWTGGRSASAVHVRELTMAEVKLTLPGPALPPLRGKIEFEANGTVKQATLENDNLQAELAPRQNGMSVKLSANDLQLPLGPPVMFSQLKLEGIAEKQHFTTTNLNGRIGGGAFKGTLAARWEGPMIVGGEFQIQGARLEEILPQVVPEVRAKGYLATNARYAMQADPASGRLGKPLVEGSFAVTRGELSNIDLVRAIQSPGGNTFRGGKTAFDELRGTVQARDGEYNYRQLQLSSGPINATGQLDVVAGGQLNGRLNAEVAPHGSVTIRASLNISGTTKDPRLTR